MEKIRRSIICGFLAQLLFVSVSFQALAFEEPRISDFTTSQQLGEFLVNKMKAEGTGALDRYFESQAQNGETLTDLRKLILSENGGKVLEVQIAVHPDMKGAVDFENSQLALEKIDFIKLVAKEDATLTPPSEPFKAEKNTYRTWRLIRSLTIPALGLAGAFIQLQHAHILGSMFTHDHLTTTIPALAKGLAVFGLEMQFALLSSWWNKHFWSKNGSLISARIPKIPVNERNKLAKKFEKIVALINKTIDAANGGLDFMLRRGELSIFAVNQFYGVLVAQVGLVALMLTPGSHVAFGMVALLSAAYHTFLHNFIMSTVFYTGLGITMTTLSLLRARNELSEAMRLKLEFFGVAWANLLRGIYMIVPSLEKAATDALIYSGGALSLTALLRKKAATSVAEQTGRRFEANASGVVYQPTHCDRFLKNLYDKISFGKSPTSY